MMAMEADAAKLSEEERLRLQIQAELEARKLRNGQAPVVTARNADDQLRALSFALDDFVRYMVWESTREDILSRFDDIVMPLLEAGRTLHIIAHSWGTVVSYEGLRRLDGEALPGRVANLVVLGSALSIGAVQRNLFGRVSDGRKPKIVETFVNVDAGGDIVGGDISPPFDVTRQFLNQKPTGCATFWPRRRTARSFTCAHGSYFQPENTGVQRDIIAHYINAANTST
jgi:pimeloyl-ACP methyl ester carboxylesterase